MGIRKINESTLTAIGNAIRSKTGGSALINPENMASAIANISTGETSYIGSYTVSTTEDVLQSNVLRSQLLARQTGDCLLVAIWDSAIPQTGVYFPVYIISRKNGTAQSTCIRTLHIETNPIAVMQNYDSASWLDPMPTGTKFKVYVYYGNT